MSTQPHILINGLSIGGGGGVTVGRELLLALASVRPAWTFSLALIESHSLHESFRALALPANTALLWAPPATRQRLTRSRWENHALVDWVTANGVSAVVQLNGQLVRRMPVPTLCHLQDPWPYRPEAWNGWRDPLIAFARRRAHRFALRNAASYGWTSEYLRDVVARWQKIKPRRDVVYYNGLSAAFAALHSSTVPPLRDRPNTIVSVGEVGHYKRQWLVIDAMALLSREPGMADVRYRIVGGVPDGYRAELTGRAERLGIADRVKIVGRVSESELVRELCTARCLALMSVCESFGIPAIEAMAAGTPVVAANACALPEVCGAAGMISPVDDAAALAKALRDVLTSNQRAEALRAAGFARARAFQWSQIAQRMTNELDAIRTRD